MSSMSLENKAIIFGSFVVGMLIFAVAIYVLKNHKLTHVVTLRRRSRSSSHASSATSS